MRRFSFLVLALCLAAAAAHAQQWTPEDSLALDRLLRQPGEIELSLDPLSPQGESDKPWLDFDPSLPSAAPKTVPKGFFTLKPYKANTPYNWDPVYQRWINIDKQTFEVPKLKANLGQTPTGMDFMAIFTKDFWQVRKRRIRRRTLEVLNQYGDSVTAGWKPIPRQ